MAVKRHYEQIDVTLTPRALEALVSVVRERADDEWESEQVANELHNLANDFESRLQRIKTGDVQGT